MSVPRLLRQKRYGGGGGAFAGDSGSAVTALPDSPEVNAAVAANKSGSPNAATPSKGLSHTTIIAIAAAAGGLVLLCLLAFCVLQRRSTSSSYLQKRRKEQQAKRAAALQTEQAEKAAQDKKDMLTMLSALKGDDCQPSSAKSMVGAAPPPYGICEPLPGQPVDGSLAAMSNAAYPAAVHPYGQSYEGHSVAGYSSTAYATPPSAMNPSLAAQSQMPYAIPAYPSAPSSAAFAGLSSPKTGLFFDGSSSAAYHPSFGRQRSLANPSRADASHAGYPAGRAPSASHYSSGSGAGLGSPRSPHWGNRSRSDAFRAGYPSCNPSMSHSAASHDRYTARNAGSFYSNSDSSRHEYSYRSRNGAPRQGSY